LLLLLFVFTFRHRRNSSSGSSDRILISSDDGEILRRSRRGRGRRRRRVGVMRRIKRGRRGRGSVGTQPSVTKRFDGTNNVLKDVGVNTVKSGVGTREVKGGRRAKVEIENVIFKDLISAGDFIAGGEVSVEIGGRSGRRVTEDAVNVGEEVGPAVGSVQDISVSSF